jgi:hypothetical protein
MYSQALFARSVTVFLLNIDALLRSLQADICLTDLLCVVRQFVQFAALNVVRREHSDAACMQLLVLRGVQQNLMNTQQPL